MPVSHKTTLGNTSEEGVVGSLLLQPKLVLLQYRTHLESGLPAC